jgi:hypothetical protein
MTRPFDWKARVDAAVEQTTESRPPVYGNTRFMVNFRTPAGGLIRQAAEARGVTVAGFVRRATLAMVAQTLGMTYQQVIDADPTIQRAGKYSPAADPEGKIGGPWEIEGLK